jgi:hypothetical protein
MTSYYTYNVFPYGTYEISAAILLQYNNNTVYPDIVMIFILAVVLIITIKL